MKVDAVLFIKCSVCVANTCKRLGVVEARDLMKHADVFLMDEKRHGAWDEASGRCGTCMKKSRRGKYERPVRVDMKIKEARA